MQDGSGSHHRGLRPVGLQDQGARGLLESDVSILPGPSTFYGGGGGQLFDHFSALKEDSKITSVQVWETCFHGIALVGGIRIAYTDGRAFSAGKREGAMKMIDLGPDESINRVSGRSARLVDSLTFYTNKGRSLSSRSDINLSYLGLPSSVSDDYHCVGGGGQPFDTGVFPDQKTLRYLRGRDAVVLDALAFAIGDEPEALNDEISIRAGDSFGGSGGAQFDDVVALGNIQKILKIKVYHASRIDGLEISYQTKTGEKTVMHGNRQGTPSEVDFTNAALREVHLRAASRVDQITFVDTQGRVHGPFGGQGGNPRALVARKGEVIVGFFGRDASEIDQLGVFFQTGAIDRIEITGPASYTEIETDVSEAQAFRDVEASTSTLTNCDGATSDLTGTIEFSESVSQSETFSLSSTRQVDFELSTTVGVEVGGPIVTVSASSTITVGNSFSVTNESGKPTQSAKTFTFAETFVAKPGEIVTAKGVFSRASYQFAYSIPVNVFYLADPNVPVRDTIEGVLSGNQAGEKSTTTTTIPCP